jgi:putative redox protein
VVVQESGEGRFAQRIAAGRHALVADEPESYGGNDGGPGPYDLLLAGLGACTSMTVRLYAERQGWPLERATVTLRPDKIHAKDCAECETREGRLDRIERRLRLDGQLEEAQRAKLLDIADKCPVHRTLKREVVVATSLESPARAGFGRGGGSLLVQARSWARNLRVTAGVKVCYPSATAQ